MYVRTKRSEHSKFLVPLYYKTKLAESKLTSINVKCSFIEVSTATCDKEILFDKPILDFGEVSVKTRKVLNVGVYNSTNEIMNIQIKPLIISNCFSLVNAVREVMPKTNYNFIIDFVPQKDIPYYEDLTLYTEKTQATLRIVGKGVSPEIEISIDKGFMFTGNTCVGNPIEKSFEIRNKSNFPISFEIATLLSGKKNKYGLKPFTFIPFKGDLKGEEKREIKVIFQGDHPEYLNFFEYVVIDVPNQKTVNCVFFTGCVWPRQCYVRKHFIPVNYELKTLKSRSVNQDLFSDPYDISLSHENIILLFKKAGNVDALSNMLITEKVSKRKLIIGNCKLKDPKMEKNANFEVIIPKDDIYFSCDNPKGTIASGFETIITFSFKKPPPDPLLGQIAELEGLGMWITTKVEVIITGGYIPVGIQDLQAFDITLKAYVEQL